MVAVVEKIRSLIRSSNERARMFGTERYIVLYSTLLHWFWAFFLLLTISAAHSTPLSIIVSIFGRWGATGFLAGGGVLAQLAVLLKISRKHLVALLLIPQQFLLFLSCGAGIHAAALGHYADGVPRPWEFILGDQLPMILVAFLYTTALITIARRKS